MTVKGSKGTINIIFVFGKGKQRLPSLAASISRLFEYHSEKTPVSGVRAGKIVFVINKI